MMKSLIVVFYSLLPTPYSPLPAQPVFINSKRLILSYSDATKSLP